MRSYIGGHRSQHVLPSSLGARSWWFGSTTNLPSVVEWRGRGAAAPPLMIAVAWESLLPHFCPLSASGIDPTTANVDLGVTAGCDVQMDHFPQDATLNCCFETQSAVTRLFPASEEQKLAHAVGVNRHSGVIAGRLEPNETCRRCWSVLEIG